MTIQDYKWLRTLTKLYSTHDGLGCTNEHHTNRKTQTDFLDAGPK